MIWIKSSHKYEIIGEERNMTDLLKKYLAEFSTEAKTWFDDKDWLDSRVEFFEKFFKEENLVKAEWEDFQAIGENLHSFSSMGIAKKKALGSPNMPIERYREIFLFMKYGDQPINEKINTVLDDSSQLRLKLFNKASITELFAYAFPEDCMIYNKRDREALAFLDYGMDKIRGEKFGDTYLRYVNHIKIIVQNYLNIVDRQTSAGVFLEVDQFLSWVYQKSELRFSEIIEELKLSFVNDQDSPPKFIFQKKAKNFVWIADSEKIIGANRAHYEIIKRGIHQIYVELHFEDKNVAHREVFSQKLNSIPADCEWFKWEKSKSIRIIGSVHIESEDIVTILKNKLLRLEEAVGSDIRDIIKKKFNESEGQQHWIFSSNPKDYDAISAFRDLDIIDWSNPSANKIEKGDIVYFYLSENVKSICIKAKTIENKIKYEDTIDDVKYHLTGAKKGGGAYDYVRVKLLKEFSEQQKTDLHYHKLLGNGLNGPIQGKIKPSKPLLQYIHNVEGISIGSSKKHMNTLSEPRNTILYGPPGTGKTYNTINKAVEIIEPGFSIEKSREEIREKFNEFVREGKVVFTTFHQSMSYEDFVEGIKPIAPKTDGSNISYRVIDGIFKIICEKAKNERCVLIIDEINRGNISAIFGELISLIEEDKRVGEKEELKTVLPYSKNISEPFGVPSNLYIIGTMNTADRSVEALDTALRRRFSFQEMSPNYQVLEEKGLLLGAELTIGEHKINLVRVLEIINERIEILLDRDHLIGHSYFMNVKSEKSLKTAFDQQIIPLLQEYFYGDYGKISLVLGKGFCSGIAVMDSKVSFADASEYDTDVYSEKIIYTLHNVSEMGTDGFVKALLQLINVKPKERERSE
jgi:hypothetical protein